ncbi:MAG: M48 family metallopeptidase [Bacteroidota bacterium]
MSAEIVFYLLLGILTLDFAIERILSFLNQRSSKQPIPKVLNGIYDEENYQKSQRYQSAIAKFSGFSALLSFIVSFFAIYLGWFGKLDTWISAYIEADHIVTLIFFGIIFFISDFLSTPFSLYQNFVIEEKFGFNQMTLKTFFSDKLKSYFLTLAIGGILIWLLLLLIDQLGAQFWWYFWAVLAAFTLFANLFYTSLILPLFNKLKPMEDGSLKEAINAYSEKVKFPLTNIFVMDGSKRSSKGNAFFSGLGKKKKVVLYDTLIENHTTEELTAVFAHEVGHYKKKHIVFSTALSIGMVGFMLFLFSRITFNAEVAQAMGGTSTAIHLNLLAFGILYSPISTLIGLVGNWVSRKNEFEADAYAKETYAAEPLITGLKKMSSDHLANLTPHPAYVFLHYSHPPLRERIQALSS